MARQRLNLQKSNTILEHLDQVDNKHVHKYKEFGNHSKNSDLPEVKQIIEELLNKHAINSTLSLSEQYILTGYLAKYIELTKNLSKVNPNPFHINRRL